MADELYQFLASDYYATGEGRTVMLLITRAYPVMDDYEAGNQLKAGRTAKVRAAREFMELFGSYFLQGAENLSREEFFARYGKYLPATIERVLLNPEQPGNFNFYQSIHLNFG